MQALDRISKETTILIKIGNTKPYKPSTKFQKKNNLSKIGHTNRWRWEAVKSIIALEDNKILKWTQTLTFAKWTAYKIYCKGFQQRFWIANDDKRKRIGRQNMSSFNR